MMEREGKIMSDGKSAKNLILSTLLKVVLPLALVYIIIELGIDTGIIDISTQDLITNMFINIILAVSLNLINGITGQFSLGHAGFMMIGCYVVAVGQTKFNIPFIAAILIAAVLAGIVGLLVGIPTLRLNGDYLAIATLGMGEIIRIIFTNIDYFGGAAGIGSIPNDITWNWTFFVTVISVIIIRNFVNSRFGRACISVREDEIAAEAMGINTTKYKVIAFVIGAAIAGVAGTLYASNVQFIKPDMGGFMKSVDILIIVVLGGLGSLSGSIIAAILLTIFTSYLQDWPSIRMILYSVTLIIVMIFRPKGLMGGAEFSWKGIPRFFKNIIKKFSKKGGAQNAASKG